MKRPESDPCSRHRRSSGADADEKQTQENTLLVKTRMIAQQKMREICDEVSSLPVRT
jgi:hypothetical protein